MATRRVVVSEGWGDGLDRQLPASLFLNGAYLTMHLMYSIRRGFNIHLSPCTAFVLEFTMFYIHSFVCETFYYVY